MIKMSKATELTLFSTLIITVTTFMLYLMILSEVNTELARMGFGLPIQPRAAHLALFIPALLFAYLSGALIIDRTLNQIEKLNNYIERQKRFISDASHELSTPITVINGHADLLLRRGFAKPELTENSLNIIKSEVLRMNSLIDSLLMLALSDSNKLPYTFLQVDINSLLAESIAETAITAPGFTLQTDIKEGLSALCDEYAIKRLLRIILSNAVKYSEKEKLVQIQAYKSGELLNILVKDKGIGIEQKHLPFIFERFYRVDLSRSKKTGSSGLGLAIAKEIIDAHKGSIQVKSREGQGTEFHIVL